MGKEPIVSRESREPAVKKRKKEDNAQELNTTQDLYMQTILYEGEEVKTRNPDDDLDLFDTTCRRFHKIIKEISDLKQKNTDEAKAQLVEKRTEGVLLFAIFKKLNRLEKFRTNQSRDTLHKVKQQVDSLHLQLQNLLYETFHLQKEVTKCLQFKSKDKDIDLVSKEDFYKEAPVSISRPKLTRKDDHQLQLARLEWELQQRKEIALQCQNMQTEKEKVASEILKKQTRIDDLAPLLKEILAVAKPVQDSLNLGGKPGPSPGLAQNASLLPHPLYFLFVQADAYKEACDSSMKLTCAINGDKEEAQRLKRNVDVMSTAVDSDSDNQEETSNKRHHRKKSRAERLEERKKQLLMAHPLSVEIGITLKDGNTIAIEFFYLINLHVVTMKAKMKRMYNINDSNLITGEHILTELFPNDFGTGSPNIANYYQLKEVGIETFDSNSLGLAYIWAQKVCGLNFTGDGGDIKKVPPSSQISQLTLPSVIKAIKNRLRARSALCFQLQPLELGQLPVIPEVSIHFPQKLIAKISKWSSLTWQEYEALNFTSHIIKADYVSSRDIFYKAQLTRGEAEMTLAVAIKNCYPELPPIFALQTSWLGKTSGAFNNDSIRDIEREVNIFFKELVGKIGSVFNLLCAQIYRLVTCFDVLLESSGNTDFNREKVFLQTARGRNRSRPLKYLDDVGGGIFTQR
uniref:THO complex subunit 5 homolog n=1 Tax=Clastoptera arizonana TaxID=38151 RepID=A0A1B6C294_9HEMI